MAHLDIAEAPDSMIFEHCRSIHTFGMRFDLLVVFLDASNVVLDKRRVRPRRIVVGPRGTRTVVEFARHYVLCG